MCRLGSAPGSGEVRPSAFWWCLTPETYRGPWAAARLTVVTPFTAIPFNNFYVSFGLKSVETLNLLIDKIGGNDPLLLLQRCHVDASTPLPACQPNKAVPATLRVDSNLSNRSRPDISNDIPGEADIAQEEIFEGEISANHRFVIVKTWRRVPPTSLFFDPISLPNTSNFIRLRLTNPTERYEVPGEIPKEQTIIDGPSDRASILKVENTACAEEQCAGLGLSLVTQIAETTAEKSVSKVVRRERRYRSSSKMQQAADHVIVWQLLTPSVRSSP